MIIQQKKSQDNITFSTLEEGNAFRVINTNRSTIWMKTQNIITEFDCYNAVDLSDGSVKSFNDDEFVIPVKVIVVEE